MPKQLSCLQLTSGEREYLQQYVRTGQRSARAIKRAHILLYSEAGHPVSTICEQVGVSPATAYSIRHRYKVGAGCGAGMMPTLLLFNSGTFRNGCEGRIIQKTLCWYYIKDVKRQIPEVLVQR